MMSVIEVRTLKTEKEIKFREEIKKNFANNLDYWSKKRGIKQVDIVNMLKVSKSTVSTWFNENSPKMPGPDTIHKLANIFEINMSDLLEDKQTSESTQLNLLIKIYKSLNDDNKKKLLELAQLYANSNNQ